MVKRRPIRRRKRLNFDSLMKFLDHTHREIRRCEKARAYLAGIVLMGAAVEYALARRLTGLYISRSSQRGGATNLLSCTIAATITVRSHWPWGMP